MGCAVVDEITPSLTNLRERAPPKSVIPTVLLFQSIAVEYAKEYIIVESMDSRVLCTVSSLECRRRQSYVYYCECPTFAELSDLSHLTFYLGKFQESGSRRREVREGLRAKNTSDICQLRDSLRFNGFLEQETDEGHTDLDLPHTKFTATRWLRSVKTLSAKGILPGETKTNLVVQQLCSLQTHLT